MTLDYSENEQETSMIGFGDTENAWLTVYIANRPPLDEYEHLDELKPLNPTEVAYIAKETGNHWRKIFNVYSKLVFSYLSQKALTNIHKNTETSWQAYREHCLLQNGSKIRLLFNAPSVDVIHSKIKCSDTIHLIMGKHYAQSTGFNEDHLEGMVRLDSDFAIWPAKKLIVCPYFDYRQLSNIKIDRLIELMNSLEQSE